MVTLQRQIRVEMTSKLSKGQRFSTDTKFLRFFHLLIIMRYNLFQMVSSDFHIICNSLSLLTTTTNSVLPADSHGIADYIVELPQKRIFPRADTGLLFRLWDWNFTVKEPVIWYQSRWFPEDSCTFLFHYDNSPTVFHARLSFATNTSRSNKEKTR